MVVSIQLDIPFYRVIVRQRAMKIGASTQIIGRTAIPFLRKFDVPLVKPVIADFLEFAVPEIAEFVSGKKSFKTAARNVLKQTFRKPFCSNSSKQKALISIKQASSVTQKRICKTD